MVDAGAGDEMSTEVPAPAPETDQPPPDPGSSVDPAVAGAVPVVVPGGGCAARTRINAGGSAAEPDGDQEFAAAVRAAQQGDEAAFRLLYRTLQPALLRYLRLLVGDDADDVASETWLQIARDLAGFRGTGDRFRGWAATVARHRAMDHLRSTRRRPAVATPIDQLVELPELTDGRDTASLAVEAISTEAALALIATLPADQAEAVLLRAVIGLDSQAAGRVLGKRAGAVRTAAYRGLRRLAEQLQAGTGSTGGE